MIRYASRLLQGVAITIAVVLQSSMVGCAGLPKEVLEEANHTSQKDFLLGPEDVLDIVVWRNQDLSKTVAVRPDGIISMPLIGDVKASGLTTKQLAERITERLKEYKENPSVSVTLKEVNSYNIYVLGEVIKPGKYQLKSYTTVLQAIAMAGGFTVFASRNKMQVVRISANSDGRAHEIRIPVQYDQLVFGKGPLGNFILKSGDIVVVP